MDCDKCTVKPKNKEFCRSIALADVLEKLRRLRKQIEEEDRMTTKILEFIEKCESYRKDDSSTLEDNLEAIKS